MSPRGAGTVRSVDCWRSARARHAFPCANCTRADWIRMASANTASVACASPMRLERIMFGARSFVGGVRVGWAWEQHLLIRGWDVHVQALLGDRLQARSARCIADRRLQSNAVRLEPVAPLLELSDFALLLNAENSPCNDARRHQDETDQHHRDQSATTRLYSALRHARSRALDRKSVV